MSDETVAFAMAMNGGRGLCTIGAVYRHACRMTQEEAAAITYPEEDPLDHSAQECRDSFDYESLREELWEAVKTFGYRADLETVLRNS